LLADLSARGVARVPRREQRLAGLEDECLHLFPTDPQDARDLVVRMVAQLEEDECAALVVGKVLQVEEELLEVGPPVHLCREALDRRRLVGEGRVLAAGAEDRETAVSSDGVKPGLELDLAVVGAQRPVGGEQGVLKRVLGLLARAEHMAAEREQPAVVAIEYLLEGSVVARADARDESLVAAP